MDTHFAYEDNVFDCGNMDVTYLDIVVFYAKSY